MQIFIFSVDGRLLLFLNDEAILNSKTAYLQRLLQIRMKQVSTQSSRDIAIPDVLHMWQDLTAVISLS